MKLTALVYLDPALRDSAQSQAHRLGVPCVHAGAVSSGEPRALQRFLTEQYDDASGALVLVLAPTGLALHALGMGYGVSIRADFHGPKIRYRRQQGGGRGQMIAKAVGIRRGVYPLVLDATAGLGADAFVLASLGCHVILLERVPVVHALLKDGLAQARRFGAAHDPDLLKVLDRMSLLEADALDYLSDHSYRQRPDVIYLDPMFPVRTKRALVKKEMRVFHALVGLDRDAAELLPAALSCARYRVVVKRPRIAPALSGPPPGHVLKGKRSRYDLYPLEKLPDGLHAG